MRSLLEFLKEKFFDDRRLVLIVLMLIFPAVLLSRLFVLQIVRGADYQANYDLHIERTETIEATRGRIYDRDGELLAYNELAYAVTIKDENTDEKNHYRKLNARLYSVIRHLEKNGDSIDNSFGISLLKDGTYEYNISGTNRMRFKADVFGHRTVNELGTNKSLGEDAVFDEADASAAQIMEYLKHKFSVSDSYEEKYAYQIVVLRYSIYLNRYHQYTATTIASNVSDRTVAFVKENTSELPGCDIEEKSIRKYNYPEVFSSIVGYTGKISQEEYQEAYEADDTVTVDDVVGKTGIEQVFDDVLSGKKGYQKIYADNSGNAISVTEKEDPVTGSDVYLSESAKLSVATYSLLEKEIAGILYSKIVNLKEYDPGPKASSSDIVVPIYDVYNALIANNLLDLEDMAEEDATKLEKSVYSVYQKRKEKVLKNLESQLLATHPTVYKQLPEEYQEYSTYLVKKLRSDGVIVNDLIDTDDSIYKKWSSENLSVQEYLTYALEKKWIDISSFSKSEKYVDTTETYQDLVTYIIDDLSTTIDFGKKICHYAILDDDIRGYELCAILYDQGVLKKDKETRNALASGEMSAYDFLKKKIKSLEITPGQLALDPCSGSSVVIDTKTGEVLACVTYPGYDNNRLANNVDTEYYSYLLQSMSNPLYNHATQQETAPGSTFKPCSSVAALSEGVINLKTEIEDKVEFDKVSNKPKCWIYPNGSHGTINVSEAIRDSCNYFFYEVGWRLAGGEKYSDEKGIASIRKYATMFGLGSKTGIEIEENKSQIATEFPVMAAIGQSNHNYTTIALARYSAAIASSGTVYDLSVVDHVQDPDGNVTETYGPEVKKKVDVLSNSQWDAIHYGMKMVTEELTEYDDFPIEVAGKTGTAQEDKRRPNHALFIGYAPYNNPRIALATRIANGYTSHNAAEVSRDIIGVYFGVKSSKNMLSAEVREIGTRSNID